MCMYLHSRLAPTGSSYSQLFILLHVATWYRHHSSSHGWGRGLLHVVGDEGSTLHLAAYLAAAYRYRCDISCRGQGSAPGLVNMVHGGPVWPGLVLVVGDIVGGAGDEGHGRAVGRIRSHPRG